MPVRGGSGIRTSPPPPSGATINPSRERPSAVDRSVAHSSARLATSLVPPLPRVDGLNSLHRRSATNRVQRLSSSTIKHAKYIKCRTETKRFIIDKLKTRGNELCARSSRSRRLYASSYNLLAGRPSRRVPMNETGAALMQVHRWRACMRRACVHPGRSLV